MSRLSTRLAKLRETGRKALVPYIVCGDPNFAITLPMMHALVQQGADVIELGVPFSDPMAEGPTIQFAHERALVHNTSLRDTLNVVAEFRKTDTETPVVLMGYTNPVEVMGYELFAELAGKAGVDGLITVDLPPEEAAPLISALQKVAIDPIFLIAPTTTMERAAKIAQYGRGFLYYVSFKGVTGANRLDIDSVVEKVNQLRSITSLPLFVGFGIKDGHSAAAVASVADGAVVGSVLVSKMGALANNGAANAQIIEEVTAILAEIRTAIDAI